MSPLILAFLLLMGTLSARKATGAELAEMRKLLDEYGKKGGK